MKELKVGMWARNKDGKIKKLTDEDFEEKLYDVSSGCLFFSGFEVSPLYLFSPTNASYNILDLIEPMDLLFVDIDNGYEGGIIVPRIAETMSELNEIKEKIKSGNLKLKYIVTKEEIECRKYEVE